LACKSKSLAPSSTFALVLGHPRGCVMRTWSTSPSKPAPGFPWLPLAGPCPTPRKLSEDRQAKLAGGLARFFEQLDISHGSPRDERSPGVVFFGAFFFDCFYGDSTGVVFDQPSVKAAPAPEPHGYSLSVPVLRQIPGQRASPVRLRSPGILPLPGAFVLVRRHSRGAPELPGG
jgi:hypothetical protein